MKQFDLKEYLANPSRKVVTRDGRKVTRILCTDARGKYPIVALIEIAGEERVYSFIKNGCWDTNGGESVNDLFFAPEKHEGWINIYRNEDGDYKEYASLKFAGKDLGVHARTIRQKILGLQPSIKLIGYKFTLIKARRYTYRAMYKNYGIIETRK